MSSDTANSGSSTASRADYNNDRYKALVYKFLKAGYIISNIEMVGLKVRGGNDFYKRRKGYTYFQNELKFFKMLKNNHYIGYYVFSKNVLQRFLLRVVLYPFVNLIYKKVMR